MKSTKPVKSNLINVLIFCGGVIVTLAITKLWNKIFPEPPVIIKEVVDSVKVIHEYKIPFQDDSLEKVVENQFKNLKLLNNYEQEIEKRKRIIKEKSMEVLTPNLVLIDRPALLTKGYAQGDHSAYFTLNCPDINKSKTIDFMLDFLNPSILDQIAFLRLEITRYQSYTEKYPSSLILSEFYEVKSSNDNFIRIDNNLPKGKYQIAIGFTLKKDLNAEYPTFYLKKCNQNKE